LVEKKVVGKASSTAALKVFLTVELSGRQWADMKAGWRAVVSAVQLAGHSVATKECLTAVTKVVNLVATKADQLVVLRAACWAALWVAVKELDWVGLKAGWRVAKLADSTAALWGVPTVVTTAPSWADSMADWMAGNSVVEKVGTKEGWWAEQRVLLWADLTVALLAASTALLLAGCSVEHWVGLWAVCWAVLSAVSSGIDWAVQMGDETADRKVAMMAACWAGHSAVESVDLTAALTAV
jgi:hypothetical protein